IWNGTMTRSPGAKFFTALPTSTTRPAVSWPSANGPGRPDLPLTMMRSISQRVTASGCTSASPSWSNFGSGTSHHSMVLTPTYVSCRIALCLPIWERHCKTLSVPTNALSSTAVKTIHPSDWIGQSLGNIELTAGDTAIGLEIALAGGLEDAGGQGRCRRFAVPAAGATLRIEVIAQRLLVEARLRLTGSVA